MSQITRRSALTLLALAAAPAAASLSSGTAEAATLMRATGSVNVRAAATAKSARLGVLAAGTRIQATGAVRNGFQPVSYRGRTGWVSARYLTTVTAAAAKPAVKAAAPVRTSAPVASSVTMPSGVTANGQKVAEEVRANFGQIATMYGRRNEAGSDHNTGRAVDIMLPDYRNNAALGQAIADHMRANASRLGISYVIFNQHIWSVARSAEGWRAMANRGSDNANHKNHVHVSVN